MQAAELLQQLLGLSVHPSQIYRLTNYYGAAIETDLDQPVELTAVAAPEGGEPQSRPAAEQVVYVQADGAMVSTDEGFKENKLARIFRGDALTKSTVEGRGGHIGQSVYVAHLGPVAEFRPKFHAQVEAHKTLGTKLVFLSDGAAWLRQSMSESYPQATLILDFYHAMEHLGEVSQEAFAKESHRLGWLEEQRNLLLDSKLDSVLGNVSALPVASTLGESVCSYLTSNRDRMDYKGYRERDLLIGSGAIESAHRTVVAKRLKRSGQRWSQAGAQRVLNLRVCWMSDRWDLVRKHIEPYSYAMAA